MITSEHAATFPPYERRSFPPGAEIGALAALGPAMVRDAAHLVTQGRVYDLDAGRFMGMPLWPGHPPLTILGYRSPLGLAAVGDHARLYPGKTNSVTMGFNSDMIIASMHTGAHIDALSHTTVGEDHHWFNGFRAATDLGDHGPLHADASTIPPIVARGILVDIPGCKGVPHLGRGEAIARQDVVAALERQQTAVRPGDVVLVRTGQMSFWPDVQAMDRVEGAGVGLDAARWLVDDMGVVCIGADTASMEVKPSQDPDVPEPVHIFMLIDRGAHILEWIYLEDLARDKVYEFMFVALPLKVKGATASMIRPIAIR
jgi:kynurenine formamidase